MSIDSALVRRIGNLAKIELSTTEVEMFADQLGEILNLMNQLDQVDTSGVEALNFEMSNGHKNRTEDVVKDGSYIQRVLENAPAAKAGVFTVKKVIE